VVHAAIGDWLGLLPLVAIDKSEAALGRLPPPSRGFNPLKDLYRTEVLRLAIFRNAFRPAGVLGPIGPVLQPQTIAAAATTGLAFDPDEAGLPADWEPIDDILRCLVEREMRIADIVGRGHDRVTVGRIEQLLNQAEGQRRQAAPGVRIGGRAFGHDRRWPVTHRFRDSGAPARAAGGPPAIRLRHPVDQDLG
jgi:NAD+ synthase